MTNADAALDPEPDPLALARAEVLAGDGTTAAVRLERMLETDGFSPELHYWLSAAYGAAGRKSEQVQALRKAETLHGLQVIKDAGGDLIRLQQDAAYAAQVAAQFYQAKLAACASIGYGRAAMEPGASAEVLLSYGLSLQHQGRVEDSCAVFQVAAQAFPSPSVHAFLIYPQMFCDDGDARQSAAARAWARRYAPPIAASPLTNTSRSGRRLRIGYVAPRFAGSQLMQFVAPLLQNHDPDAVSVTLYPTDASTEAGWPERVQIRPLGRLNDADAAALIRADRVDVLCDCWGHTAGSRLPVFAHRPAPVQVAWINFVQTTGLEQMDYVLHADAAEASPDIAGLYTETIWPIGPVFNVFRAAGGRLPVSTTPALRTGHVTFGSFNHPAKLSDGALDAWAGLLRGVPTARLVLKYSYFDDPVLQNATCARFAARGVSPERIAFAGHSSGEVYFRAFHDIDLMLDAWPAPGSTTTLDALSNGVPVLVKPTATSGGQCVRAMLTACGLPELIAADPDDFVRRGVALAGDLRRLDAIRARVRPGFDGGPLSDEVGFTRRVERAFCAMFDLWRQLQDRVNA